MSEESTTTIIDWQSALQSPNRSKRFEDTSAMPLMKTDRSRVADTMILNESLLTAHAGT